MSRRLLAVAALLVLAAVLALLLREKPEGSGDVKREQSASPTAPPSVGSAPAVGAVALERSASDEPMPAPSDSGAWDSPIDRARDLHGIVYGPDGAPFPSAEVTIVLPARQTWGGLDLDESRARDVVARLRTNGAGAWRHPAQPGSWYEVDARAEALIAPLALRCQAGERVDLHLAPLGSIAGRVTRAEDGAPLPDEGMRVFRLGGAGRSFETRTDADGAYLFAELDPGEWIVDLPCLGAQPPGWQRVMVEAGAETRLDLALPRGPELRGLVLDALSQQPIAGAEVSESWTFDRIFKTGADGRFVVTGAGAEGGSGSLHARATGYGERGVAAPADLNAEVVVLLRRGRVLRGILLLPDGNPAAGATVAAVGIGMDEVQQSDWLTTRAGADGRFEIRDLRHEIPHALLARHPHAGVLIRELPPTEMQFDELDLGQVRMMDSCVLAGLVVDGRGAPVPGCELRLSGFPADRSEWNSARIQGLNWYLKTQEARADDLGRFRFAGLSAGSYELVVQRGGFPDSPAVVVDLMWGSVEDLHLVVPEGMRIAGIVVDPDGNPVSSARVFTAALAGGSESVQHTGADGRFNVNGLPPGLALLEVGPPRPFSSTGQQRLLWEAAPIEVAAGSVELRVVLPWAAWIRGRVVDEAGVPASAFVSGTLVGVTDWLVGTETSVDGEFALLVPATASITLEAVFAKRGAVRSPTTKDTAAARLDAVPAGADNLLLRIPARP